MGVQQLMLGVGASKKTYLDDVFSTYVYKATGSNGQQITNGIDLANEGGLVWFKGRSNAWNHALIDTIRGGNKLLFSDSNISDTANTFTDAISSFNSNGFTTGTNQFMNYNSSNTYASWTFRKAPGFFTVVSWTGNGTNGRQISHDLNSIPGCVMVKCTNQDQSWSVYHRGLNGGVTPEQYHIILNNSNDEDTTSDWNDTAPTSTHFTVGDGTRTNYNGYTYVAYVFAGGESTAATARSVVLDGTGDYLSASSSDFAFGTGDFTIEGWFNKDDDSQGGFWDISTTAGGLGSGTAPACAWTGSAWQMYGGGDNTNDVPVLETKTWFHVAQVRASGVTTMYVNGSPVITKTDTANYTGTHLAIGGYFSTSYLHEGKISNFRIVKGTAVYTSAFRPPTEPLTNITNTKLLCCNNSSTTGSTVTPGTITANGDPTASTDSPFDDPAAFKFGDSKEGIIKCGSYTGNGSSSTPPEVNLGWEPQWVMVKRTNGSGQDWVMVDSMRGMFRGLSQTPHLRANSTNAEQDTSYYRIDVSSGTGFAPFTTDNGLNGNGDKYIYIALRRPDGYVGKPPELGTGVFAMDTAASSYPKYSAGFAPDWVFSRRPAVAESWKTMTRLTGTGKAFLNTTAAWGTDNGIVWDNNTHFKGGGGDDANTYKAWMWKRHAGFDVVTYKSDGVAGRQLPHSLGRAPEMLWIKDREHTRAWAVYHKGLNGGTNPEDYWLNLDTNDAEASNTNIWHSTAPTATHISLGASHPVNTNLIHDMICLAFASVDGISKVGTYAGSNSAQSINCGFQPRFVIIKNENDSDDWLVFDTTRGWGSGDDKRLKLNDTGAQSDHDVGAPTSTGFDLTGNVRNFNQAGRYYIFYAHA